jgi:methylglutaconyl-CoA hydratase
MGLVHLVVPASELDTAVAATVRDILSAAPSAIARAKHLLATLGARDGVADSTKSTVDQTSRAIAEQRVSPEGQEGLRAFLEKRKPRWAE